MPVSDDRPLPPRPGPPPFVRSFLDRFGEMQARESLRPGQLEERAEALLEDRLGPSESAVATGSAHASLGVLADHTHFFDGFGATMGLRQVTAVAVRLRPRGPSLVVLEGQGVRWSFGASSQEIAPPLVALMLEALLERLMPGVFAEVAIVSTIPEGALDALLSALGTAFVRALRDLPEGEGLAAAPERPAGGIASIARGMPAAFTDPSVEQVRAAQSTAGQTTGIAYPLAAAAATQESFSVLDAATREVIPLDAPDPLTVGWALVDVSPAWSGHTWVQNASFYTERAADVAAIVRHLRSAGFPVSALRDLEHATLEHAVQVLPESLRPTLRYLVGENRRVQKLIVAIRKDDWQMLGALLTMSHAARVRWGEIGQLGEAATFVVDQAQSMNLSGVFGAGLSGRGGGVLLVGRPFSLPGALEQIEEAFRERFGVAPISLVL